MGGWWLAIVFGGVLVAVAIYDLLQTRHAILKNFPIIGHFRYWLEAVGPELRQYIVTSNDEERPFSRDQRRWVYASAKAENNYFGFGTDNEIERMPGHVIVRHSAFPTVVEHEDPEHHLPGAKILGGPRGRRHAFRPSSLINLSAMSYGSLSRAAVEAINRGCAGAGCLHNTGEGGISRYHDAGGDLIWQVGTGYFGCRDESGRFSMDLLCEAVAKYRVRVIEIKLSQGAKPGKGGVLPQAKITDEIARIRGIPRDRDCLSPSSHREFHDVDSMLDFVERIADLTGLPVGIKSAVGQLGFFEDLASAMASGTRGVDYIAVDGGEGGTGAAPMAFSDHVALPFRLAIASVYRIFAERGLTDRVTFIGSGKLGFPDAVCLSMALGCDLIAVAREAMLAVGCIQAQRCHNDHCPTGVATQNRWLVRGLDVADKSVRVTRYIKTLRKEVLDMTHACGLVHPAELNGQHVDIVDGGLQQRPVTEVFGYRPEWGSPSAADLEAVRALMTTDASAH